MTDQSNENRETSGSSELGPSVYGVAGPAPSAPQRKSLANPVWYCLGLAS